MLAHQDVIEFLDQLRRTGLVALVKADGERSTAQWTVMVTGTRLGEDFVRVDGNDLGRALSEVAERLEQLLPGALPGWKGCSSMPQAGPCDGSTRTGDDEP